MEYNKIFNGINLNQQSKDQSPIDNDTQPNEPVQYAIIKNCSRLNLRKEPGITSPIIAILDGGDRLVVSDSIVNWTKVATQSGLEGYVMSEYVKEA